MSSSRSIFISYRRSDTIAETERIYDRLVTEFGREHVFKDVDDIPLGVDFAEHLDRAVGQCQVLLVIMGKTWATVTDANGRRRLDDPDDFVRIEVEAALRRQIPVIPVLLEGVSIPTREQLPVSLHLLLRRNGTQVGYDPRFHPDMNRLITGLQSLMRVVASSASSSATAKTRSIDAPVTEPVKKREAPTFGFDVVTIGSIEKGGPFGLGKPQVKTRSRRATAECRSVDLGQGVTLELVRVPGGRFQMGSPADEGDDDERPRHEVSVGPFWLGKYPVTQAQWRAVSALPRVKNDLPTAPAKFSGENKPVEQVNWDEAVEFCQRLSRSTGQTYRLPSEAEWEYACRAGTTTAFYFGKTITTDLANYRGTDWKILDTTFSGNYGSGPKGKYREKTIGVGSFPANAFGLYDLHGNVREWCQDHWHENYAGAPTDGSAWLSADEGAKRLLRGGSWYYYPVNCRSANRVGDARDDRYYSIGFRVVCVSS